MFFQPLGLVVRIRIDFRMLASGSDDRNRHRVHTTARQVDAGGSAGPRPYVKKCRSAKILPLDSGDVLIYVGAKSNPPMFSEREVNLC